ncbi:MAG: HD domain-containing protein, partial [Ilumatobacteraceae bacterium]
VFRVDRHLVQTSAEASAYVRDVDRPDLLLVSALLHDIGKVESSLGIAGRVVATVLGPRTTAFRRYLEHESLGEQLLRAAGSDARTLDLLRVGADAPTAGSDVPTPDSITQWRDALRRADAV